MSCDSVVAIIMLCIACHEAEELRTSDALYWTMLFKYATLR